MAKFVVRLTSKRNRQYFRVGLAWMLCLMAWRGPVPVIHNHSLDSSVLADDLSLARHAIDCHAGEIDHAEAGWHLHFVVARDRFLAEQRCGLPPSSALDVDGESALAWLMTHCSPMAQLPPKGPDEEVARAGLHLEYWHSPMLVDNEGDRLPTWVIDCSTKPHKKISHHALLCVARC